MPPIRAAPFRKVPSPGVWPVLPGASSPHCCWPGLWVATGCAPLSRTHPPRFPFKVAPGSGAPAPPVCSLSAGGGQPGGSPYSLSSPGPQSKNSFYIWQWLEGKSKQEEYLLTCENLCEVQIFASVKRFYQVLELAPHSSVWLEPRELAGERGRGQAGVLGALVLGAHVPSTCCVLCTGHPLC